MPAVNGVLSVLDSAYRLSGPQLKNIVMMSSDSAIRDPSRKNHVFTEDDWNTWAEPKAKELGDKAPAYVLYPASKTLAERAFWRFYDEKKVSTWIQYCYKFALRITCSLISHLHR